MDTMGVGEPCTNPSCGFHLQHCNVLRVAPPPPGNIELLIQRGEKLEDLDTAAVVFNDNAREFQKGATGVNRKMSWKKWKVCV